MVDIQFKAVSNVKILNSTFMDESCKNLLDSTGSSADGLGCFIGVGFNLEFLRGHLVIQLKDWY